jgi:hypothetical protein
MEIEEAERMEVFEMEVKELYRKVEKELAELDVIEKRLIAKLNGDDSEGRVWNKENLDIHKDLVITLNVVINRRRDLHTWKRLTDNFLDGNEIDIKEILRAEREVVSRDEMVGGDKDG